MHQFKEGDVVEVINDGYAMSYSVGKRGRITSLFGDRYCYVSFEDGEHDSVDCLTDIRLIGNGEPDKVGSVKKQIEAIEAALQILKQSIGI